MVFKLLAILTVIVSVSSESIPTFQHVTYIKPRSEQKTIPFHYVTNVHPRYNNSKRQYLNSQESQQHTEDNVYHKFGANYIKTQPENSENDFQQSPHPQYKFNYNVQDSVSGDTKSHMEIRDGDAVQGEYSLIDADGYKRTVLYTSDPVQGFKAIVRRDPITEHNSPFSSRTRESDSSDPVVKGAYAVTPIIKAVPVAFPLSPLHNN